MADITAKRGPIDPNDYVTNQGVATQAQLRGLDRDIRYHENQPSTWDRVMGGIKDVMYVGESALNMANSYKNLDVKDTQIKVAEEQIEASKLNRQKTELDMERTRQTMKYQGIKNDLALQEYRNNNAFVSNFSDAISNYDYDKAVQLSLTDPVTASKNSGMLLYVANNLESMGKETEASQLRMIASQNMSIDQLQKMYDLPKVGQSAAFSQQKLEHENFKNLASVFQSGILKNGLNTIPEIDTNPRLTLSNDIGNELLQNCEIHPMANKQQVDAINSILNDMSGKDNGLQSLELDDNKNKYQSAQNNLSYAVVSCIDPKDPNKVVDRILAYDGKAKQQVPKLDKYGNLTGTYETITNDEVVNRLASNQTKAKNARDNLMKAPNINPETTPKEPPKNTKLFKDKNAKEQNQIIKLDDQSFEESRKDLMQELERKSVTDENGKTLIGKDIVTYGMEDIKDNLIEILQNDSELSNNKNTLDKYAEQELYIAMRKAGAYLLRNDLVGSEDLPQLRREKTLEILREQYPELSAEVSTNTSTTEVSTNTPTIKPMSKESERKLSSTEKSINLYNIIEDTLPSGDSLEKTYTRANADILERGKKNTVSREEYQYAIGQCIKQVLKESYKNLETPEEYDNLSHDEKVRVFIKSINKLKTDFPKIYDYMKLGKQYDSARTQRKRKQKEELRDKNFE